MDFYDAIIHLNSKQIINQLNCIDFPSRYKFDIKNFEQSEDTKMPITDFNPVDLYLNQLRSSFSDFALFFYDYFGGNKIGVLWKPNVFEVRQFKVSKINAMMPTFTMDSSGCHKMNVNVEALIEDFVIIGDGIVKYVENRINHLEKKTNE